jgi:hypothetical protein
VGVVGADPAVPSVRKMFSVTHSSKILTLILVIVVTIF